MPRVLIAALIASLLYVGIANKAYKQGYNMAKHDLEAQWLEGTEGTCLADTPPHPGPCH